MKIPLAILAFALALALPGARAERPVKEMHQAMEALVELLPFLMAKAQFADPANRVKISAGLGKLSGAFGRARHRELIREDVFAPSYDMVTAGLADARRAFDKQQTDYAFWRLKEVTTYCIDCHSRIPEDVSSSFQRGEMQLDVARFPTAYTRAIGALIVRRYFEAMAGLRQVILEEIVKQDFTTTPRALQLMALIELKIRRNPKGFDQELAGLERHKLSPEIKREIDANRRELASLMKGPLARPDVGVEVMVAELKRLQQSGSAFATHDLAFFLVSGALAHYGFLNPTSPQAPEILFWLGVCEKTLKRENIFGGSNEFFKTCIKRYATEPVARDCLREYEDSVTFDFGGSSGVHIPPEVQSELELLRSLLPATKEKK